MKIADEHADTDLSQKNGKNTSKWWILRGLLVMLAAGGAEASFSMLGGHD
jgi:hypothetical protein